jgi:polyisoprenoid-binding protein YceI
VSRAVRPQGGNLFTLVGDLTLHGVTREVTLDAEFLGALKDPWGNEKLAFAASGHLNRHDFGLNWNKALETGGVLVGERVDLTIEAQLVKAAATADKAA